VLRAVIFDYGNTLIGMDPATPSARTDYADIVARPGAERLAKHLADTGALNGRVARFIERFLEVRERNRLTAEQTGREITAEASLAEVLGDEGGATIPPAALREAVAVYFSAEEERIVALPGALETLEALRAAGVKLGLLSNATDGRYVERVAKRWEMRSYFDPFLVSSDLGVRKPRAETFRAILDRWALPAAAVAMVGDSLFHDVDGANRLGLYTVHFTLIPNPGDPPHAGTIVPRASADSHTTLRTLLGPLLQGAAR
jgi:HAD superfamily hydrolase (TIGR01662 family)